jgi:phosphate/sulfate permease
VNTGLLLLIITVAVALAFDFLNGFHDADVAPKNWTA